MTAGSAGRGTLLYSDPTAWWVPLLLVVLVTAGAWGGMVWESDLDFAAATQVSVWVLAALLAGVALQGWVYWKGQVARLSFDGGAAEAVAMRWVGPGRRIRFTPFEATGWSASAKSTDARVLGNINVKVRGETLSLSMLNPAVADLDGLARLNPEFFRKLRADYPGVVSKRAA